MAEQQHARGSTIEEQPTATDLITKNLTRLSMDPELSPAMAFTFDMLPSEVRLETYRWAVGNRTIHVRDLLTSDHYYLRSCAPSTNMLRYYVCRCPLSEAMIYESYKQPIVFKNKIDWHMRPRFETMSNLHDGCLRSEQKASQLINPNILAVSREAHDEAVTAFYLTNKWSFADSSALNDWLIKVPDELLLLVQHVHLEMHMARDLSYFICSTSIWKLFYQMRSIQSSPTYEA